MSEARNILEPVNKAILGDIKRELRLQGHHLTGTLEASLTSIITETENNISLSASAKAYLEQLEYSTPASQIDISEAEFQGLRKWTKLRGLATTEVEMTQIAAAIVRKWKKEGRPTENSKQFSKTGRRTQAVGTTFIKNSDKYDNMIDGTMVGSLDKQFSKTKSGRI